MRILLVKLSSLGDVVHAMPALQDIRAALPAAQIDWVVERGFAPLVKRCAGVAQVIACDLRHWRKAPFRRDTREQWAAFRAALQQSAYDVVIDLQGLAKSAIVARLARLAEGGKRYALANRTLGAGYEAPTRWVADVALRIEPLTSAVERSRQLCAKVFGYEPAAAPTFGLRAVPMPQAAGAPASASSRIAFVHGTSRADKEWPAERWVALGRRLNDMGLRVAVVHGSDAEQRRSERIAAQLANAEVWPRMQLDALCDALAGCSGVIGVDSGLSHVAVALDLPHVQLYNVDTAWRTGPPPAAPHQRAVFGRPTPELEPVWQACRQVLATSPGGAGRASRVAPARQRSA